VIRICSHRCVFGALTILCVAQPALFAAPIVIDFEGLTDGEFVTTQYPNLTFSNAVIATAGMSLNDLDFPPKSGVNVVIDDGGPISVVFSSPVSSFGGFFTYIEPLTMQGFGSSNNLLATSTSLFSKNLACLEPPCEGDPGSSPNEFIQVNSPTGFSSVTIAGDPRGFSFALDNVTYSLAQTSSTPEPSSFLLFTGMPVLFLTRRTYNASLGRTFGRLR
jgi:hypothetical protein